MPRWDSNDAISQDLPARMPNASSSTEDDETTPPFSLPSGKMGGKTTMSSPIETPDLLYEVGHLNLVSKSVANLTKVFPIESG